MIDRMVLKIGGWRTTHSRDDILSAIYHLGHMTVEGDETGEVNFFQQRQPRTQFFRQSLPLRGTGQGQGTSGVSPIVAGELTIQMMPPMRSGGVHNDELVHAVTTLHGKFNPTRWIMAQRPIADHQQRTVGCVHPFALAIARKDDWWRCEIPYVENNNVIMGADARFGFARSKSAEEHLCDYVSHTVASLTQNLVEVGLTEESDVDPNEFILGDIEFYWEFAADDPISLVETLKYYLTAVSGESGTDPRSVIFEVEEGNRFAGPFIVSDSRSALVRSSPSFWFKGRRGVRFKVYAKTDRRLRFEVCLSPEYRPQGVPRRSFDSIAALVEGTRLLKVYAAQLMNAVLDDALSSFSNDETFATRESFVSMIVAHSDNSEIAHAILSELRAFGRVAPYPKDLRYRTLRRLRTAGVLQIPKSAPRVYSLTPTYRPAASYPEPPIFRR
ncbi:hypothetical protein ACJ5NV_05415 [Loktanella agnita]|uniref:hypothetical protein n=1 Tax=Loktanella agnita TaxID=287097 RepID=UPI003986C2BA